MREVGMRWKLRHRPYRAINVKWESCTLFVMEEKKHGA